MVLLSVMSVIHYVAEEYPDTFINNFKVSVIELIYMINILAMSSLVACCLPPYQGLPFEICRGAFNRSPGVLDEST